MLDRVRHDHRQPEPVEAAREQLLDATATLVRRPDNREPAEDVILNLRQVGEQGGG